MTERKRTAVERLAEDDAERELEARDYAWAVEQYTCPAPSRRPPAPAALPPAEPAPTTASPPGETPAFLTTKQAAALLGVSVKHLEGLRARGGGPPFVRIGHAVRYPRATLALPK